MQVKKQTYLGLVSFLVLAFLISFVSYAEAEEPEILGRDVNNKQYKVLEKGAIRAAASDFESYDVLTLPSLNGVYESSAEYLSPVTEAEYNFTSIGLHWIIEQPAGTNIEVWLRFQEDEKWHDWQEARVDNDLASFKPTEETFGELVFTDNGQGQAYQYKVILSTDDPEVTPIVKNVEATYINSNEGLAIGGSTRGSFKATGPTVISRAAWGANEAYAYWAPEYREVGLAVMHHTAGPNNPSDPAATIRSIYYYHAVSRNWGDIGYNYIIDQYGNIYEGRKGGLGVVGAHALGYNYGSVGISILGTYSSITPYNASIEGAAKVVGWHAGIFGYAPDGHGWFGGRFIPTTVGHRDVGQTACPGNAYYAKLQDIRNRAVPYANIYGQVKDGEIVKSLNQNDHTIYYIEGGKKRPFTSADVLRMYLGKIRKVSDVVLSKVPTGEVVPLRNGKLVKPRGQNTIYFIQNGKYRAFSEIDTYIKFGFHLQPVYAIDENDLNLNTEGELVPNWPDGKMVRDGNSNMFRLNGGKKYRFASMNIFNTWETVYSNESNEDVGLYKDAGYEKFAVDSLVSPTNDNTVFAVDQNGYLRPLTSWSVLTTLGYSGSDIHVVAPADMQYNPQGENVAMENYGVPVKTNGDNTIYHLENGALYPYSYYPAFATWHTPRYTISLVPQRMDSFRRGNVLGFNDGSVIQAWGQNTIYRIENNLKRGFATWYAFINSGHTPADVILINPNKLNLHATGVPIY